MKSRKSLGKFDTYCLVNTKYKLWFAKGKNDNCIVPRALFRFLPCLKMIAAKMKFGKTKCSYFIDYGLAPYIKEQLGKYISSSPLYVVSFDESMNSVFQNDQMDVAMRFWNNSKKQAETRYLTSEFLRLVLDLNT